ncbi:hypothetical protein FIBSPDRAFT_968057 [Athelia psychrophila]|uniref:Uncharacterized protein n=1 Tax=Athelia psychrophila TaxID=1759441 RepID=A0A167V1F1_9AGAM|nr:hypothetical protein FIBSPDRAFT_968057 [Fibularhizoctonia sp. CBS 109695]
MYLLSRISAATSLLLIALFTFVPTGHCEPLVALLGTCGVTLGTCTSFLFFLRVRAVYQHSRSVTAFFGILWLAVAILNIVTYSSLRAAPVTDNHCIEFQMYHETYPVISSFIFDTFVFTAISYRLAADAATDRSWNARLQSVVTGKGLFRISRSLMISGQLYYLAIILFFWVNVAVMVSPRIPASYHFVLSTPYMMFTNVMACRVFRGVALGMLEESPTAPGLSSTRIAIAFELTPVTAVPSGPPYLHSS